VILASDQRADSIAYSGIPCATEQGISKRVSGKIFQGTGNRYAISGPAARGPKPVLSNMPVASVHVRFSIGAGWCQALSDCSVDPGFDVARRDPRFSSGSALWPSHDGIRRMRRTNLTIRPCRKTYGRHQDSKRTRLIHRPLRGHRSTGSAEFSFLLSLSCTTETRHDERHKCALMARSLVCSVALSGQAPKPHSGAPQARALTANARTEQTSVLPRCAPTIGRSQSCRRSFFSAPAKLGSIHPHAMHDDRQPSRHSDDCALHPTMPGNLHAPGLEPRPLAAMGHQHQGCLEQHLAHHGISGF